MRLQIILQMSPNPQIGSYFGNLPDVFLPVLWFDAEAVITHDIADQLKMIGIYWLKFSQTYLIIPEFMPVFAEAFGILSVLLAMCILLILLVLLKRTGNSRKKEEEKISKSKY